MKTVLMCTASFLVGLILAYPLYLYITYTDESVTEGSGLGFVIGESKLGVFKRAPRAIYALCPPGEFVFIQEGFASASEFAGAGGKSPYLVQFRFKEDDFVKLRSRDEWKFYIGASLNNFISLKFCDGNLCEVWRHRKTFEVF